MLRSPTWQEFSLGYNDFKRRSARIAYFYAEFFKNKNCKKAIDLKPLLCDKRLN